MRLLRWLRPPAYIALALSVAAVAGQAAAYPYADTTEQFSNGMLLVVTLNALAGIVLALTANPIPLLAGTDPDDTSGSLLRIWPAIGLSVGIQIIGGFVFSVAAAANGDWTPFWLPLAVGAGIAFAVLLLAWLAGMLVLWPLITLIQSLWTVLTRRAVSPVVTAGAILFLTISALAVTAALGTDFTARGQRGGLRAIVRLWADETGDPSTLVFRWTARCLMVILVLVFVWFCVVARKASRATER